jgi:uncharacterized membrane protein YqgA involved in biofilm formation
MCTLFTIVFIQVSEMPVNAAVEDKYVVPVWVLSIIFGGIITYILWMESRLKKLENKSKLK